MAVIYFYISSVLLFVYLLVYSNCSFQRSVATGIVPIPAKLVTLASKIVIPRAV